MPERDDRLAPIVQRSTGRYDNLNLSKGKYNVLLHLHVDDVPGLQLGPPVFFDHGGAIDEVTVTTVQLTLHGQVRAADHGKRIWNYSVPFCALPRSVLQKELQYPDEVRVAVVGSKLELLGHADGHATPLLHIPGSCQHQQSLHPHP